MDLSLTEKQEILLYKACKNHNGTLSMHLAESTYSSANSAKRAIDKLKMNDYISQISPGYWRVEKVTDDVKQELKQSESFSEGSGSSGSEASSSQDSKYEVTAST
jgi:hypothetical protein